MFEWVQEKILDAAAFIGMYREESRMVIIGLDNAGKTSFSHLLSTGRLSIHPPTLQPLTQEVNVSRFSVKVYDLGGHEGARRLWGDYCGNGLVDGIIFIVDVGDFERFEEAKVEFNKIRNDPGLAKVPLLILGNKIDVGYISQDEFMHKLDIYDTHRDFQSVEIDSTRRSIVTQVCSVLRQYNVFESVESFIRVCSQTPS